MIHVVDYGAGNVGSVLNMISRTGGSAVPTGDASTLSSADKILLPGVGSFDNAIRKLRDLDLFDVLRERATSGIPFLGICLGMQLLASGSEEGELPGLALIPGLVRKFSIPPSLSGVKIPHMGWNKVRKLKEGSLTRGMEDSARFYFVHSYHLVCDDAEDRLLETHHGHAFTSSVERGNIMGVQFHPEKSHRYGMQLIKTFVDL